MVVEEKIGSIAKYIENKNYSYDVRTNEIIWTNSEYMLIGLDLEQPIKVPLKMNGGHTQQIAHDYIKMLREVRTDDNVLKKYDYNWFYGNDYARN
jgi:hypothetical protein